MRSIEQAYVKTAKGESGVSADEENDVERFSTKKRRALETAEQSQKTGQRTFKVGGTQQL